MDGERGRRRMGRRGSLVLASSECTASVSVVLLLKRKEKKRKERSEGEQEEVGGGHWCFEAPFEF